MFHKILSFLGLTKPQGNPSNFIVQSTHRSTQEIFCHEFDTQSELDAFLAGYKPTAHLNYIRTKVYACFGSKQRLLEVHEHLTANTSFEFKRFEGIAASVGAKVESLETYPNESSAVSSFVRLRY